jgi:hypothetical protein
MATICDDDRDVVPVDGPARATDPYLYPKRRIRRRSVGGLLVQSLLAVEQIGFTAFSEKSGEETVGASVRVSGYGS